MDDKDRAEIQAMILESSKATAEAVLRRIPAVQTPFSNGPSRAEIGSPEFAEDRTQINSLNNKWMFEAAMDRYFTRAIRSDDHLADLQSRSLQSLDTAINLQTQVNEKYLTGVEDGRRIRDSWNYVTAYDLSNPNTLATSDDVRGGVVPQNRAIDTATAQSALNNTSLQAAILGAVADAMNGTIPTLEAAVGAAVAAALVNTPTTKAA